MKSSCYLHHGYKRKHRATPPISCPPTCVCRPFPDYGLAGAETREIMKAQVPEVVSLLQAGGAKITIHCAGGKGRTGTVAASFLVKTGMSPAEAIATVRSIRPGTVENEAQEGWVAKSEEIFGPPLTRA
jgi:protein-tyrosine phosphatase